MRGFAAETFPDSSLSVSNRRSCGGLLASSLAVRISRICSRSAKSSSIVMDSQPQRANACGYFNRPVSNAAAYCSRLDSKTVVPRCEQADFLGSPFRDSSTSGLPEITHAR